MDVTLADQPAPVRGRPAAWMAGTIAVIVMLFAWVFVAVPDRLFADDSYFYFQVAWNVARGMGSTFNNLMPTNGYHPLWMLLCAAVFHFVPSRPAAVHAIAGLISVLDMVMLLVLGGLLRRYAGGLWPLAFVLVIPFAFGSQLGTEGALSGMFLVLLMAASVWLAARPTWRSAAGFSLVAGLAVLSRLDNIFIVVSVSVAVFLLQGTQQTALRRRLQLMTAPIALVLWAGYVASNWMLFGTIQPISGMLKSASGGRDHAFGANLPHTAIVAIAIIVPAFLVVARFRRDRFFECVERPFAIGVLCHAIYIVFFMSNETRWTWYYTSWILLASVLLSRTAMIVLERRPRLAVTVCGMCCLVLLAVWYRGSYRKFYRGLETRPPSNFNADVYTKAGIHRALAYDEPGVFAYYSDIQIVPIDGLMGDLKFQHDLATTGVQAFIEREHIDGFIGPDTPANATEKKVLCDKIFLSSEQFHCRPLADGRYALDAVDIYARLPKRMAGTIELHPADEVWRKAHSIIVWRLHR